MPSPKLALSFRLSHNGQLIREETLTQSVIKIGKVPSAHLQIADDAVSRMHAIVEVTGRDVSLIDLGSTRGSFVNGKKVNKARLESGDVITLGDTRVELTIHDAAALATERGATRPPAVPTPARRGAAPLTVVSGVIETVAVVAPVQVLPPTAVTAAARTAPPSESASPGLAAAPSPATAIAAAVPVVAEPPGAAVLPVSPGAAVLPAARPLDLRAEPLAVATGDPGAAAIEVAAMLGDSVVGVKHCIDPRGGKIAPATWGLVAGGAVCLLASAIAFCGSVATAADNHERLDAWIRVEHRPAYAFRPVRLGPAVDAIAFGGFGLAIVGLGLGIARMRRERVSPYYRIGTAPGVELAIEGAPAPAFPLVAPSGDDFVFQFAPGIDGELLQGGSATPLTELAAAGRARPSASTPGAFAIAIPRHARIRARAGGATLLIAAVPRPRRHAAPLLAGIERRALVYAAGSLAVHLAIWGILQLIPPEAATISLERPPPEPILVGIQGVEHEDPVRPVSDAPGGGGGAGGPRMALPEGASGGPEIADPVQRRVAGAELPPALSREDAIRRAREAGFLGRDLLVSAVHDLADRPAFADGFEPGTADGALIGDFGGGGGGFGAGRAGAGLGGGCSEGPCGDGLIAGAARYGTIDGGPGAGGRYGLPGRGVGTRQHAPLVPTIGTPRVDPGYDKTIVRRYIRRSVDKIAYCYNSQLLAHPGIEGEVLINFFIAPTGAVGRSSGTGFDAQVARCVADIIRAIEFPRPGDGAGVEVNYPFQFHAAGR
ncbi:MAG TPA: AgmX/PglI C-terminal domain-containing protein [Kofleriaceae bacterium]|nr:AgmX/PglI C-terminal domain-containing protein [Kofleriaceae bacterium]